MVLGMYGVCCAFCSHITNPLLYSMIGCYVLNCIFSQCVACRGVLRHIGGPVVFSGIVCAASFILMTCTQAPILLLEILLVAGRSSVCCVGQGVVLFPTLPHAICFTCSATRLALYSMALTCLFWTVYL